MKQIFSYLKPYRYGMLLGFLIKTAGTFADLGLPYVLSYILDDIIPMKRVSMVILWGTAMITLAVLARTLNITANRMAAKVARDSIEQIRHDLFEKIFQLSGSQTDAFSIPSLVSRLTSDTYNVHHMIGMMQRLGIRAPLILLGGIIITFSLEPVLTLVMIAVLPLLVFVIITVSRKGIPFYTKVQKSVDGMVQTLRENISGIRVIKALSKTEYEKKRFYAINNELSEKELRAGSIMAITGPGMNILLNFGLTFVIVVGAYRVNNGVSEPGKIVAFLYYFTMILNAVLMINRIFVSYSKASASAARITEVLSAKEDLIVDKELAFSTEEAYIIFDHVSFGYHVNHQNEEKELPYQAIPKENKLCLKGIDFRIKKGESLGIIGSTGSGKTTIINLLMRFYDVMEGNIYIDGKNVRSYNIQDLRGHFGTVFQNDIIFADTISENIQLGREMSMKELESAAIDGQAAEFIAEKEGGFAYTASVKGADFSGGQKQRLFISRAMAAHPDILVLDDSSSALDYKTDAKLRGAIRDNYSDTTIIMIAQRISSIMQMDHILVLEDGEMLGFGSHEELLKHSEVYREIYHSQIG